jgi:hypothetical protein
MSAAALDDPQAVRAEFRRVVNMTAAELERWLETDASARWWATCTGTWRSGPARSSTAAGGTR